MSSGEDYLQDQRCFILNFGFKQPLSFPEIKLYPNFEFQLNVGSLGLNSPNKCSIVVIGGKYPEQVDEVMRMVDKITEDIAWMPSAVFLMAEKPGQDIKFTVSTRHRRSPTMYQVPATRSSVVQFVMTCPGMSHSSTFTLHMRDNGEVDDGKVWGDLCREKRIYIAYNLAYSGLLEVDDGKLVLQSRQKVFKWGDGVVENRRFGQDKIALPWEIFHSFFTNHDIDPVWINCDFTLSKYDEELGMWTGAVGKVSIQRDKLISYAYAYYILV